MTEPTVRQQCGQTKLTTEEYNALLQKWLQDAKQRKRELERSLRKTPPGSDEIRIGQEPPAGKELAKQILSGVKKRIEMLERAIALNFDPDEFERVFNVPIYSEGDAGGVTFHGMFTHTARQGFDPPKQMVKFYLNPLARQLKVDVYAREENYPACPMVRLHLSDITSVGFFKIVYWQDSPSFVISSATKCIYINQRAEVSEIDRNI